MQKKTPHAKKKKKLGLEVVQTSVALLKAGAADQYDPR